MVNQFSQQIMAIISTGGTSYPDFYICLFLLCLAPLSTTLNILVLRHNLLKPPSLPRKLFLMLATADLLASVYISLDYSVGGLAKRDIDGCARMNLTEEFCNEYYVVAFREASVGDIIRTAVRQIFTLAPCYLTGLLAITRFYHIKHPLRHAKEGPILGFLMFNLAYICAVFILFFRKGDPNNQFAVFMPLFQNVWNIDPALFGWKIEVIVLYILIVIFAMITQILATATSFLTIIEMVKMYKKPMSDAAKKNSISVSLKILITNFGSFANIVLYVVKAYILSFRLNNGLSQQDGIKEIHDNMSWFFAFVICYTAIVPVVLSTLNPAIYIALTPSSRKSRKVDKTSSNSTIQGVKGTASKV